MEFIERIGFMRHFASHRGSITPAKLIDAPERELTDDEVDRMIADSGDELGLGLPPGQWRDHVLNIQRHVFRMRHYEKEGLVLDGVVPIEIRGKKGFIRPEAEIDWMFQKLLDFHNAVLIELEKCT